MPTIISLVNQSQDEKLLNKDTMYLFVEEDLLDKKTLDWINGLIKDYKKFNPEWTYDDVLIYIEQQLVANNYTLLPVQYTTFYI